MTHEPSNREVKGLKKGSAPAPVRSAKQNLMTSIIADREKYSDKVIISKEEQRVHLFLGDSSSSTRAIRCFVNWDSRVMGLHPVQALLESQKATGTSARSSSAPQSPSASQLSKVVGGRVAFVDHMVTSVPGARSIQTQAVVLQGRRAAGNGPVQSPESIQAYKINYLGPSFESPCCEILIRESNPDRAAKAHAVAVQAVGYYFSSPRDSFDDRVTARELTRLFNRNLKESKIEVISARGFIHGFKNRMEQLYGEKELIPVIVIGGKRRESAKS